jgi:hypothetical protein
MEEAVTAYRRLAEASPAAYLHDLTTALNNLGGLLSALGRDADATAVTTEASQIRQSPDSE